jgi:hypothetical protein
MAAGAELWTFILIIASPLLSADGRRNFRSASLNDGSKPELKTASGFSGSAAWPKPEVILTHTWKSHAVGS